MMERETTKPYKGRGEVLSEVFGTESLIDLINEIQVQMGTGNGLKTINLIRKAMQKYAEEYANGTGLRIEAQSEVIQGPLQKWEEDLPY